MERSSLDNLNNLVNFQINRNITALFKEFLRILEEEKVNTMNLENTLIKTGLEVAPKSEMNYIKNRKLILDKSNDCIRELNMFINKTVIRPKVTQKLS